MKMIRGSGLVRLLIVFAITWVTIWGYAAWSGYEQAKFGKWITTIEMSQYYIQTDRAIDRRYGPHSAEGFQKNMEFDAEYGTNYWNERAAQGEDRIKLALWVGILIPTLLAIAGWWIFQGFNQKGRR